MMDRMLEEGDWNQIRNLRNPKRLKCHRLKNAEGQFVESDEWADTMAAHLETIQWRVRPMGRVDGPALGAELPINVQEFTEKEIRVAVNKLKRRRASGPDEIPAEFLKAVADCPSGMLWLVDFCNACWNGEEIPEDWRSAAVSAIYKKGAVDECENYRPISLICVSYKLFATLLLKRLQEGGAETRLTSTQFGFRRARGTADAVFAVRRHIDLALAQRNGSTALLALDWKKAFDSINIDALICALERFGLPAKMVRMISCIYARRNFVVRDGSNSSSQKEQRSGISQGCPLSPFLFVMLMSVITHDAEHQLGSAAQAALQAGSLGVVLYADDTLLIGVSEDRVQELLDSVADVGFQFGMELHFSKFQLVSVRGQHRVKTPTGEDISPTEVMTYLGANLYADGGVKRELNRKLGAAWGDFQKLRRLWNHTNLTRVRKTAIFQSVIVSRLMYGLSSAWLNVAEMRRLNGFQCRCLRVIHGIPPSFVSRVSNKIVLEKSGQVVLGRQLLRHQLLFFGRVARAPASDPLRILTFVPDSVDAATGRYIRKVGRPRNEWAVMLQKECWRMNAEFLKFIDNEAEWKRAVHMYCNSS
jgi:hypothetical protein